jgi:hypothetical protein
VALSRGALSRGALSDAVGFVRSAGGVPPPLAAHPRGQFWDPTFPPARMVRVFARLTRLGTRRASDLHQDTLGQGCLRSKPAPDSDPGRRFVRSLAGVSGRDPDRFRGRGGGVAAWRWGGGAAAGWRRGGVAARWGGDAAALRSAFGAWKRWGAAARPRMGRFPGALGDSYVLSSAWSVRTAPVPRPDPRALAFSPRTLRKSGVKPRRPTLRGFLIFKARWQSGHAAACKAVYAGSIPTLASI